MSVSTDEKNTSVDTIICNFHFLLNADDIMIRIRLKFESVQLFRKLHGWDAE